jgi:hypothetical protein
MTGDEVPRRAEADIDGEWDRPTSHLIDLRRAVLRPPRFVPAYWWTPTGEVRREVWLALRPDDERDYWVCFDPFDDAFGLVTRSLNDTFSLVGMYGSLRDTLEGM